MTMKKLDDEKRTAFAVANALDESADAIKARSREAYGNGKLSLDDYLTALATETELRSQASVIVAMNLTKVLADAAEAGANVEAAIAQAKERIQDVRDRRKALAIAAALITLAAAVSAQNVAGIAAAAKALYTLTKPPK